jgi:hypothetical protein
MRLQNVSVFFVRVHVYVQISWKLRGKIDRWGLAHIVPLLTHTGQLNRRKD